MWQTLKSCPPNSSFRARPTALTRFKIDVTEHWLQLANEPIIKTTIYTCDRRKVSNSIKLTEDWLSITLFIFCSIARSHLDHGPVTVDFAFVGKKELIHDSAQREMVLSSLSLKKKLTHIVRRTATGHWHRTKKIDGNVNGANCCIGESVID